MRRAPGSSPGMGPSLSMARERIEAYCDHLSVELEPKIAARSEFGVVLSGHLRSFRSRLRRELNRLDAMIELLPQSGNVAHSVHVTALVLLADLDAHARDLELIVGGSRARAA